MVLDVLVVFLSGIYMCCPCHYKCSIATCRFILCDVGGLEFCVVEAIALNVLVNFLPICLPLILVSVVLWKIYEPISRLEYVFAI